MDADDVLNSIRKLVWHHTISDNNTIPSRAAIHLRAKRFKFILNSVANATVNIHEDLDVEEHSSQVIPLVFQSSNCTSMGQRGSTSRINSIQKIMLQKCKCQKSKYLTNRCSCRRTENKRCSNLCQCVDCRNIEEGSVTDVEIEYPLGDAE